jgi:hypothetical protein
VRLSRLVPLLSIFALCGVLAPAAQARVPRDFIGITAEDVFAGNPSYRAANLSSQASVRIGLTRQTFDWSLIEASPGNYNLGYYDDYVAALASRRIEVLPILFNPPRFYRGTRGRATCPPRSNRTMAAFAQVLVRRYGPNGSLWRERPGLRKVPIRSWQVWGEASLPQYWCPRPNARAYVRMLKAVGGAIKRLDRRAEIVTAGLPNSLLRGAVRLNTYIRQMYRAKAKRYFNTLAINSYARNTRELGRILRGVRRIMNRYRDRRAKIWITEIGWGDRGLRHRFIVGSRGQASRIRGALSYIRKSRRSLRLRGFVYFSWRDSAPYPPEYKNMWGLHTGLLTRSGRRKPAYSAFRRGVRRLR